MKNHDDADDSAREPGLTRRGFLLAGGGAAATLAVGCSIPTLNLGRFAAGNVADYALGDVRRFSAGPFLVGLDGGGYYAMTALCTHRACTLDVEATRLSCPCHDSRFALTGEVTRGPARSDLDHFEVQVELNGDLFVDTRIPVSPATRLVP